MSHLTSRIVAKVKRRSFLRAKSWRHRLRPTVRDPESLRTIFLSGVQRSGTNIMMEVIERSWDSDVFMESDPRAFDHYMMRDEPVIADLVARSPAPRVIIKALHEADRLTRLMADFAPAASLWMFRHYDDVINSMLARWPGHRNMLDEIVVEPARGLWRSQGMTEETLAVVRAHYHGDLSDASANALMWWYRNRLFFDQNLGDDRRVLMIRYETLVHKPGELVPQVADFLGIAVNAAMPRLLSASSVRRRPPPPIEPPVRDLCEAMLERLQEAWAEQQARLGGPV